MRFLGCWVKRLLALFSVILIAGCAGTGGQSGPPIDVNSLTLVGGATNSPIDPTGTILQVGEKITVSFSDMVNPIPPIDTQIKEDRTILLIYNQTFVAAGKTAGQLEKEIRARYVPDYFKQMTPTVKQTQDKFFSIGGEVRNPSRQVYIGYITALGAINAAGGFTEYAAKSRFQFFRGKGKPITLDYSRLVKHPDEDKEIFPGDIIYVPRRLL